MIELIDSAVLHFINLKLGNPVLDYLLIFFSDSKVFMVPLVLLVTYGFWKGDSRLRLALLISLICIAIVDPSNYYILKKLFARPRPCHVYNDLRLVAGCGGIYGFPSNHAANSYAVAFVMSSFYPKKRIMIYGIANLICFSRIYLGKHYLGDIIGGCLYGIIIGATVILILKNITRNQSASSKLGAFMAPANEAKLF